MCEDLFTYCYNCGVDFDYPTDYNVCNNCIKRKEQIYTKHMSKLQDLYDKNKIKYRKQRENSYGIASHQIAALIDYLVELKILK